MLRADTELVTDITRWVCIGTRPGFK